VELHKLHVGEPHARTMGDRESIAGRDNRIRGVSIDLTAATRRQDGRVSDDFSRTTLDARDNTVANASTHDEIEHTCALEHPYPRRILHSRDERPRDLRAGLIAVRMDDAILRMGSFASKLQLPDRVQIKVRTCGLQLTHARRTFLDEHLHGSRIAQRRTRRERILSVQRRRVAGAQRRGNPSLRVGSRAIKQ
jgi:hypothetical protein